MAGQSRADHRARQEQSFDSDHAATRIRNVEFRVLPGLLQTADYARAQNGRRATRAPAQQ
ncbi:Scr1 family TA system antitoxin-like transcriptional regulator [Saccharopolyspora sp. NPDC000995]